VCPHCRQSALVDVVLEAPVVDARLRYQLARQIASFGPPHPALLDAQKRLASQRPVIVQDLTAVGARRALDLLDHQGLQGRLQASGAAGRVPSERPARGSSGRFAGLMAAGVLVVIAVGTVVGVMSRRGRMAVRAGGTAPAAGPSAERRLSTEELASAVLPSTVAVHCGSVLGAGFFVAEDTVLTNAHVLPDGCQPLSVKLADGRVGTGRRARVAQDVDLALISVSDVTAKPLVLGDAGDAKVGEKVLLVGSPRGFEFSVHEGLVSSVSRSGLGTAYLQLDAKINPGNSGGPAINMRGEVIGVVTLKEADAEGIGFALPINYAFAGAEPLVTRPATVDPRNFEVMLTRASATGKEQVAELESVLKGYALLKGVLRTVPSQYGSSRELVMTVGRIGSRVFMTETHHVHVWLGSDRVCSVTMEVGDWEAVEGTSLSSLVDPRMARWFGKQDLDVRLYLGKGTLAQPPCPALPDGAKMYVLELEGADPQYSRLTVR
jgi:serine protease Do